MKIQSIKAHLKPYSILEKRKTTLNNAFASAIAPNDSYNITVLKNAVVLLRQDPEKKLKCIYCDKPAKTWDHAYGLVKDSEFSGYGHVIGNLLPCCKNCNSKKGNKNWETFLKENNGNNTDEKIRMIKRYFEKNHLKKVNPKKICPKESKDLSHIKDQIFKLCKKADKIAAIVRKKIIIKSKIKQS